MFSGANFVKFSRQRGFGPIFVKTWKSTNWRKIRIFVNYRKMKFYNLKEINFSRIYEFINFFYIWDFALLFFVSFLFLLAEPSLFLCSHKNKKRGDAIESFELFFFSETSEPLGFRKNFANRNREAWSKSRFHKTLGPSATRKKYFESIRKKISKKSFEKKSWRHSIASHRSIDRWARTKFDQKKK